MWEALHLASEAASLNAQSIEKEELSNGLGAALHFAGAVVAGRAHDSAAGMRTGTTEKQAGNWSPISRIARHRPHHEHLVQAHFAVEDIATSDSEAALEVQRAEHLPVLDDTAD